MEKKLQKNISYIFQFIDSVKFMASSISNLEKSEFIELNVNMDMKIQNLRLVELNLSIAVVYLNIQTLKII